MVSFSSSGALHPLWVHCPCSYAIYENAMCCLCCYVIHSHLMFFTTCSVFGVGVLMRWRGRHRTDWEENSQWLIRLQTSQYREIIENKRPLCKVNVDNKHQACMISSAGIWKTSFVPLYCYLLLVYFLFFVVLKYCFGVCFGGVGSQCNIFCAVRVGLAWDYRVEGCLTAVTFGWLLSLPVLSSLLFSHAALVPH